MRRSPFAYILAPKTIAREDYPVEIKAVLFRLALVLSLAVLSVPSVAQDNPLLTTPDTPFQTPPFDVIQNKHFIPAVKEAIRQHQNEIDALAE